MSTITQQIAEKVHQTIRKLSDGAHLNVSGIGGTLNVSSMDAVLTTVAPLVKNKYVYDLGAGAGHAMLIFALATNAGKVGGCELKSNLHLNKIISSAQCQLAEQFPGKIEVLKHLKVDFEEFSFIPDGVYCVYHFCCGWQEKDIRNVLDGIRATPSVGLYICSRSNTFKTHEALLGVLQGGFSLFEEIEVKLGREAHRIWVLTRNTSVDVSRPCPASSASDADESSIEEEEPMGDSEEMIGEGEPVGDAEEMIGEEESTGDAEDGMPPMPTERLRAGFHWRLFRGEWHPISDSYKTLLDN